MKLCKATAQDDEDIKTFYNEQIITGLYDYKIVRPNSFFDQYALSSDDIHTFILRDPKGRIHALASVLFKKAYVNDQEQLVGYVTDLRVSSSRKATLSWTKEFVPAFEKIRDEKQCQYLFSELEQYENKAYNLLLRRLNRNTNLPRYHLFRKFNLVVIYGKKLFPDKPLSSIKIEYGRTEDIESVVRYLKGKSVRRPLRYNFDREALEKRCRSWPNFSMQNFLIAKNRRDEIIGCIAPWNNRDVQRVIAHRYHGKSFQVYNTSRTLATVGITRPLPHPGEAFSVKHITHSGFDNPDIFYSLLDKAYSDCKNKELLVYPNYFGDYAGRPPRSFICVNIPYGFYSVLDSEVKLPPHLHPNPFNPPPDFQYSYF